MTQSFAFPHPMIPLQGGFSLLHLPEVGSTNALLAAWARAGAPHGTVLWADQQTAGRGRRGHTWISPEDGGLFLSVLFRGPVAAAHLTHLALAGPLAVAELCGGWIKWPNDLLNADGSKFGGLLAEVHFEGESVEWLVLGVGVNTLAGPREVALAGGLEGRLAVAALAEQLPARLFHGFQRALDAPDALLAEWVERDALCGRTVEVNGVRGVAVGLDAQGALRIETAGGVHRVLAGDVALVATR